ncbi:MAG: polysaccharide biosynthesis protein [Clostridiales bacterium]|jgi:O-antigen/teichoic acid export membrane protein|nr:polysaccharide biosynthesis protein [Clostridiales bacterium]
MSKIIGKFDNLTKSFKDKKILSASLGYTIGNFLIKGVSFLTLPIFSRILTTSDYGLYNTFMAYESLFVILISFGVYMSIKAASVEFKEDLDGYISNIITYTSFVLFLFFVLLFLFNDMITGVFGYNTVLIGIMLLQSASTTIITIYNIKLSLDYSYKKYLVIALFISLGSVILSLLFIFFVFTETKYYGRILGGALPSLAAALYVIFISFKSKYPKRNKQHLVFAIKYSIPLVPHGISQIILSQSDRIMIMRYIGSVEAGLYSFAYNISVILQILSTSLDTVWGPWFFKNYSLSKFENIKKRSSQYISIFSTLTILLMFITPELVKVLGSQAYSNSIEVLIPVILAIYFTFLYTIPAQLEYYKKKTGLIAISTIIAGIVNIVLNMLLIPKYGYIAAAYTTLISYILNFVFHMIVSKRISEYWPFDIKVISLNIIIVIIFSIISYVLVDFMLVRWLIIVFILGSSVYIYRRYFKVIIEHVD